ncbi:LPS export ABC transporter permease LptG [Palleronia sediminis]|uniref:LPS export ABC transporter permease LptG n=1 Tax=Palleronia sediminis TaxID=2547833 RepID=A0A4R6A9J4_9RHOB|nr:LPS export ABC transporter permease LptG [Palleronia sediminis]TDL79492.1 LPS export ABC transporter permease LptG [Palleronia sediminis]
MILQRYFARRFAVALGLTVAVFFGLLLLIELVDQVRRFEGDDVAFAAIVGLTALSVPETLYTILPLLVIIATLTLFLSLARSSELVAARASGRSALRVLGAPLVVTLVFGALAVTVLNPIVAATSTRYDAAAERLAGRAVSALSLSSQGLWLRQGDGRGQTVINAARANADGTELAAVTFLGFDGAGSPTFRIEAARAALIDGAWAIRDAKEWRFDAPNPEAGALTHEALRLPSSLTANQILDSFANPAAIPVWDLPRFIAQLEAAGFSARRHRVWLHMELAQPLLLAAMMLVGAAFTMRHTRFARTGSMVLMALTLAFALFFIRNFAQILGESGRLPVLLAAWGPPVAAALLPLGLILHWEDG